MISPTGENLKIIIDCRYLPHHNWMAYASYFSIRWHLPDAEVGIMCQRGIYEHKLFDWTRQLKVFFRFYSGELKVNKDNDLVIIKPDVMAVREYLPNSLGPVPAKENNICTFITYFDGCGKFVMDKWINRIDDPFRNSFYSDEGMTVNELKILQLWDRMKNCFRLI